MSIPSILKKDTNIDMQENNINDLVASASELLRHWYISAFAAHHPWMGLEKQSFEQVANWLKSS